MQHLIFAVGVVSMVRLVFEKWQADGASVTLRQMRCAYNERDDLAAAAM